MIFFQVVLFMALVLAVVMLFCFFLGMASNDADLWKEVMVEVNSRGETFVTGWYAPMGQYLYDTRSRVVLTRADGSGVAFIVSWYEGGRWIAVAEAEMTAP